MIIITIIITIKIVIIIIKIISLEGLLNLPTMNLVETLCSVSMFKFLLHSRLDKMESLIEKLAVKVDALSTTLKERVTCANWGNSNHLEDDYFNLKTCFKCKEKDSVIESLSQCTTSQTFEKIIFEKEYFRKRRSILNTNKSPDQCRRMQTNIDES